MQTTDLSLSLSLFHIESSADEEEKAYLYEIQQNAGRSTPATMFRSAKTSSPRQRRTSSAQSNHSNQRPSLMHPKSTTPTTTDRPASSTSFDRRFSRTTSPFVHALPRDSTLFDDHLEDRIKQNPWAAHPTTNSRIPSLSEYNSQKRQDRLPPPHHHHQRLPSLPAATTSAQLPPASPSPFPGSTTSSSATITRRQDIPSADTSIISLGPATKRALESLQAEVIALNDRIDDLRNEVGRRRQQQRIEPPPKRNDGRGVIKVT